jgi:hypothetical protein
MAINYFNLTEDEVKNMKKPELCKHIRKILAKIDYEEEHKDSLIDKSTIEIDNNDSNGDGDGDVDNLNYIYKGDINNCIDSPNRGGINLKELKKIAVYNFGIDVNSKLKEEICSDIKNKLNENKQNKQNIKKDFKIDKKNSINLKKSSKNTFNDLLKDIDDEEDELESSAIKEQEDDEEDDYENEYTTKNFEISDIIYSKKTLTDYDEDDE